MKFEVKNNKLWASVFLLVMAAIIVYLSFIFIGQRTEETLYPSKDVTEIKMLSDFYPDLKGTAVDTEVYIFRGSKPGASMLVLGGTHPSEPAGIVAATLIMENAKVNEGTLYVIPRVNKSGLSCTEPQDASPLGFTIETPTGDRYFRYGSRLTNPVHQWPDPDIYYHNAGQLLTGKETRNVDRTYPGNPNGNLTEKLDYGIVQLVKTENIDMTVDLHEGPPEYPTINVIVAHQNAMDLAGNTAFNMAFDGVNVSVDASPVNLHGFSHRELGDLTNTMAVLAETVNPLQGRLVGKKDESMILEGKDKFYEYVSSHSDRLYTEYTSEGMPLNTRVARQVELVLQLANSYNELGIGESIFFENIPSYSDILINGMGDYLAVK